MKKFIISVLCAAVFFIGLGGLIEDAGARFKSDERALGLMKQAQTAIGGEEALKSVKALTIKGAMTKTLDVEGAPKIEQIELEMNLQLPNQFAKTMKFGRDANPTGEKSLEVVEVRTQRNAVVKSGDGGNATFRPINPNGSKQDVFVIKRNEGDQVVFADEAAGDLKKFILDNKDLKMGGGMNVRQNELFRTTLALLLTAPQGLDTTFRYVGDGDVDGNDCDVVEAVGGDLSVKLFLDKSSHLPRMISYHGSKPMIFRYDKNEAATPEKFIARNHETAEFQIRFSDYRTIGAVLLPYRWTQTIGGSADETIEISNYEINPANIAEKFQDTPAKMFFRSEKKPR